jgi:hypothetical protein
MKYVISIRGSVGVGPSQELHKSIASRHGILHRDVVAAGHYEVHLGKVKVYGSSIGFNVDAKEEDAPLIQKHLDVIENNRLEMQRRRDAEDVKFNKNNV